MPVLDFKDPSRPINIPILSRLKSAARILAQRTLPLKWTFGMSVCASRIKVRLDPELRARKFPVLRPLVPPGTSDQEIERQIALSRTIFKLGAKAYAPVFRRSKEWLLRTLRPQGLEHLAEVKRTGGGAIVLTLHAGLNAWAEPILRQLGYPMRLTHRMTIALDSLLLMRWEGVAQKMLPFPDDEQAGPHLKKLYDLIRKGEWIQHAGDYPQPDGGLRGVYLGAEIRFRPAPWALGRLTGAPLIPVLVLVDRDFRFGLHVGPPIRIAAFGASPDEAMTTALQRYLDFVAERLSVMPWNLHLPFRRMSLQGT